METSTISQLPFPPRFGSVDATSIRPVVATPPDPGSIPIAPPKGSPRPPFGQLLPDVAAAEDPLSPNKLQTPPPSTPSPPTLFHGDTLNSDTALETPQNMHPGSTASVFGPPDTPIEPSPLPPAPVETAPVQVQEAGPVATEAIQEASAPAPAPEPVAPAPVVQEQASTATHSEPAVVEQALAPIPTNIPDQESIPTAQNPVPEQTSIPVQSIPVQEPTPMAQNPTPVQAAVSATSPQPLHQHPMDLASPPNPMFDDAGMFKAEMDEDIVMGDSHHFGQDVTMLGNGGFGNGLYSDLDVHAGFEDVTDQYSSVLLDQQDHIDGPPTKRQKLDSPAPGGFSEDMTSAALQLESPTAPVAPWARPMTQPQNKFALSIVRTLRKSKDALPFLVPVDPVALNIPHYPQIIPNPMDISTVEKKLGGAKADTAQYPRYANVDEFAADVRLIIENCAKFNGPEHPVTQMARRMEEQFEKLMKNMPSADEVKPPPPKPVARKPAPARRPSTAGGGAFPRRDDPYVIARPKREVPVAREQYPVAPNRPVVKKRFPKRDDGTLEQLRFCTKLLNDLYRPKYSAFAYPFYEPVDYIKLEIPHYPKLIKKPMDMATMSSKLSNHGYPNATAFYNDFKLMIKNCFAFNPAGTPVHQAGVELNAVFDEKWQGLPNPYGDSDDGAEEDESDAERSNAVMMMEAQIQSLHSALEQLKKPKKEKRPKATGVPSMPKPPKAPKPPGVGGFKKKKKPVEDEDALSFEQKKQLSETIQTLDGNRLEKVLEIIDEVYPEIRETSEEIELDIDSLPSHVLNRLYNFVIRPNKPRVGRPPNGSSSSKALNMAGQLAGTKRKSMNEEEESEKIRQLEATLQRLKNGQATADDMAAASQMNGMAAAGGGDDSESESDSSDSSGSDSE